MDHSGGGNTAVFEEKWPVISLEMDLCGNFFPRGFRTADGQKSVV